MQRRNFLKNIMPLAAFPLVSNQLFANVINPAGLSPETLALLEGDIDRILVLVRLDGGNDGLNTLIPLDQYAKLAHEKVRKNIIVSENQILTLKDNPPLGMHPSLNGFRELYNSDQLTIIQGVANTAGVFSHFHGIDQWETASDKNNTYSSGWIGRYLEKTYAKVTTHYPNICMPDPLAIEVGASTLLGRASGAILSQKINSQFNGKLTELIDNYSEEVETSQNMQRELAFLRGEQFKTNDYGKKIINSWNAGNNSSVAYPPSLIPNNHPNIKPTTLAQQFKIVARLIKGGLKTRIYVVSIGNFDTHAKQVSAGTHSLLLQDLSGAITAFQKDLIQLGLAQRVLGMTYSEFGRRVAENGLLGTEHGYAAPMFLFGDSVKGGIIGNNYQIDNVNIINEGTNVPSQYDYKQVYKSVLQNWFGACDQDANDIIKTNVQSVPGLFKSGIALNPCIMGPLVDPESEPCRGTVSVVDVTGDDHHLYARIFPNPSSGSFTIEPKVGFDTSSPIFLSISDIRGNEMMREEIKINTGETININKTLSPGMYIVNLKNKNRAINQKIIVH
jgi:uncharacterized protein (DUF1501 family)